MIGLGFIGYGGVGSWHAKHMPAIKGIKTLAAHDIDPARVKAAIADGLVGYDKLEDILNDKQIHLVLVATPNNVHKELCVAAMDAGKNVVCEKPVAMNEGEVDEMIAASRRNKVLFTVHQNRRWDRDFRVAKKVFDDGLIGNVFSIESRLHGTGGVCHGWRGVAKQGGGMLYDWGVHLIDQILWMVPDEIEHVYCQMFSIKSSGCDDYFKLNIKFKSGLNCLVEVGTYCVRGLPRWYMNGDEGGLTINGFGGDTGGITRTLRLQEKFEATIVETAAGPTRTFAPQPPETMIDSELPAVETDLKDYFNNIRDVLNGKAEQIVKHSEIKRVIRVIDAAFASAKSGKTVAFKDLNAAVLPRRKIRVWVKPWQQSPKDPSWPLILSKFKASPLQKPVADIATACAPQPGLARQLVPFTAVEELANICDVHGGADGVIYIEAAVKLDNVYRGELAYGADGPVKVWVNGRAVDCQPKATNPARIGQYVVPVSWKKGANRIVFALATNHGKAWGVQARVLRQAAR